MSPEFRPARPARRSASRVATGERDGRAQTEQLYELHAAAVLAFAQRRTGNQQDAQDILAETFLVAWRRREDVPADALPWLYAVAGHVLRNQQRADKRQTALADRIADQPQQIEGPGEQDNDYALLKALATLRPIDREALLLIGWEGLDPARAAVAAGCSRTTFHMRLHRARQRLATALEAQQRDQQSLPGAARKGDDRA
jgi:RNA polymerase sigma factor (sigma-70 family)